MMQQISTSWTMFWKLFFPTFFLVFFGLGAMVFWFGNLETYGSTNLLTLRLFFSIVLLVGILFFNRSIWRLKRIDMDDSFVYVSNYFKTAKYSFDQIEHIAEASLLGSKTVKFKLVGKGVFGINILFLPDKVRYDYFFKNHPILRTLYSVA